MHQRMFFFFVHVKHVLTIPPLVWLTAIGNTPLIRLNKLSEETGCDIYGKAEFMNPGGSVKGVVTVSQLPHHQLPPQYDKPSNNQQLKTNFSSSPPPKKK